MNAVRRPFWIAMPVVALAALIVVVAVRGPVFAEWGDRERDEAEWREREDEREHERREWDEQRWERQRHMEEMEGMVRTLETFHSMLELIQQVHEIAEDEEAAAVLAVMGVEDHIFDEERRADFYRHVLEHTDSEVVQRATRMKLAETLGHLDRHDAAVEQLEVLILGQRDRDED